MGVLLTPPEDRIRNRTMICSVVEKAPCIFYIYDENGHYIEQLPLDGRCVIA